MCASTTTQDTTFLAAVPILHLTVRHHFLEVAILMAHNRLSEVAILMALAMKSQS